MLGSDILDVFKSDHGLLFELSFSIYLYFDKKCTQVA